MNLITRRHLREFANGSVGASVKHLSLEGKTALQVADELPECGFAHARQRLCAPGSASTFLSFDDPTTDSEDPCVVWQDVYTHPDGGVVHVRGDGVPGDLKHPEPHAIKSVVFDADQPPTFRNIAFRVTNDGKPVPKAAHSRHGTKQLSDRKANVVWIQLIVAAGITGLLGEP